MEYLRKVLGIDTVYKESKLLSLPYYITGRYKIEGVQLIGVEALFVYPQNELQNIGAVKKHLGRIEEESGLPVVLVLKHVTYREKEYLIQDKIPFIVEGKQIYLPFMGVYLQERCDAEKKKLSSILPSAQLLLLYYIYSGQKEIMTSDISKALSLTPTSVSRASRQLEEIGLLKSEKRGVQKAVFSDKKPDELFSFSKEYLISPVKKTIYVDKNIIMDNLLLSSYSALSEYSMLSSNTLTYLASDSISKWEKNGADKLSDPDREYAIELWRYDPRLLSGGEAVDRLSLALALGDEKDERVEDAIEEMLQTLWREIDGKRD